MNIEVFFLMLLLLRATERSRLEFETEEPIETLLYIRQVFYLIFVYVLLFLDFFLYCVSYL